jgi:uncharacterized protein YpuA (DUF1002 family)
MVSLFFYILNLHYFKNFDASNIFYRCQKADIDYQRSKEKLQVITDQMLYYLKQSYNNVILKQQ